MNGYNMLVALVRNSEETLRQLLDGLETALGPAIKDQVFFDEINGKHLANNIKAILT